MLGDAVHVRYCLVGIAVVISQSILLFNGVKWVGAAYLAYAGVKSLLARKRSPATEEVGGDRSENARSVRTMGSFSAARSGFFTSLLNPKVTLFFLTLFVSSAPVGRRFDAVPLGRAGYRGVPDRLGGALGVLASEQLRR